MSRSSKELGDLLRARRGQLTPDMVGLPAGSRRRTPGLRREEVALLADISIDWYTRLEQGRASAPSASTIEALSRALRLDAHAVRHLHALAGAVDGAPLEPETLPAGMQRMLDHLDTPAYVTGRRWDLLAWNAAADELFGFARLAPERRNILRYLLGDPGARALFGDTWEAEARRAVAQFHASHDLRADAPAFVALLEQLRADCAQFDAWWREHAIDHAASGRKHFRHPERGPVAYDYATFQSNDDPGLKLAIYTPVANAGTPGG